MIATVADLIKELKRHDQNERVGVAVWNPVDSCFEWCEVDRVNTIIQSGTRGVYLEVEAELTREAERKSK